MEWLWSSWAWVTEKWKGFGKLVPLESNIRIADLQSEIHDLKKQLREHVDTIREQQALINQKKTMKWDGTFYVVDGEDPKEVYCSRCWDSDHKQIHVHKVDDRVWQCPSCEHFFSP